RETCDQRRILAGREVVCAGNPLDVDGRDALAAGDAELVRHEPRRRAEQPKDQGALAQGVRGRVADDDLEVVDAVERAELSDHFAASLVAAGVLHATPPGAATLTSSSVPVRRFK